MPDPSSSTASRPWLTVEVPERLRAYPAMLTGEERRYLIWLGAAAYRAEGAIVDLGTWLGGSAALFVEGVRRAGRATRIHSFDLFQWEEFMEGSHPLGLPPGADFRPAARELLGEAAAQVDLQRADLNTCVWEGGPIEILFVDAAKSWALLNAILCGFAPALVPGRSRVVLQDFRYHYCHWLPLVFDSRPDLWEEVESVELGDTVTFRPRRGLFGEGGLPASYAEEDFPLAAARALLEARMARTPEPARNRIRRTLYKKLCIEGAAAEAEALLPALRADPHDPLRPDEMDKIADLQLVLLPRAWRHFTAGEFAQARALAERCLALRRDMPAVLLTGAAALRMDDLATAAQSADDLGARGYVVPEVLAFRAEVALRRGAPAVAEELGCAALRDPAQVPRWLVEHVLTVLGAAWLAQGRFAAARQALDALVRTLPDLGLAWFYLALACHHLGRQNAAEDALRAALRHAPHLPSVQQTAREWGVVARG